MSFRQDCRGKTWRRSTIESRGGWDCLPTRTVCQCLIHSRWSTSSSSLRLRILELSPQENGGTHTCLLNIQLQCLQRRFCAAIKSLITAHAYISSKSVLSLRISQLSRCQYCSPRLGANSWFKVLRFAILGDNLDMGIYVPSHNPASLGASSCSHFSRLLSPRIS